VSAGAVDTRLACVLPALDAAPTVGAVIAGLRAALPSAVVVGVDDGSADDTAHVLRRLCDVSVHFGATRGKGAALRAGFLAARAHGADVVVTVDADGQHDPAWAPALVRALRDADLAIGTRERAGAGMPVRRRLTNALSSAAVCALAGPGLADTQCGFRAFALDVVDRLGARGDRYDYEIDFLVRAVRAGLRIAAVPVPTIYGAPSHFRELSDGASVVRVLWRHRRREAY
jgi:glycosyltransferase involved in cell wall biosynthesis